MAPSRAFGFRFGGRFSRSMIIAVVRNAWRAHVKKKQISRNPILKHIKRDLITLYFIAYSYYTMDEYRKSL